MTEHALAPEVAEYYELGGEVTRLTESAGGRLEFLRTQDILRRLIGPQPAAVLDVGGATGVHARWLVEDGHAVVLVDPVASQVEAAARIDGVAAGVGDARDLSGFGEASFDVVLLLGPLYHLQTEAERRKALAEARRVARPGGLVVAAAIGRFAPWLDSLCRGSLAKAYNGPLLGEALATGQLRPREHGFDGFTTAYVHRPEQLAAEFAQAGLPEADVYAVEGPGWMIASLGEQLDDAVLGPKVLESLRGVEREPSLLGVSAHLLAASRAPR
ncbi:MAG: class I SAM-dependent methyltransferase [Stackebrandtia sp.]